MRRRRSHARRVEPLQRLCNEIRGRDHGDLSPIDLHRVPREVVPLVEAINLHTERLRQLTEAQRRFLANAAHQLKTPLAVLRAQAALALRQADLHSTREVLRQIEDSTRSTSRMLEQLLALARSDPERSLSLERVDLGALAHEVLLELVPLARAKRVDVGLDTREPVAVHGERVLLREMLANLVHNAISYTPPEGAVAVALRAGELVVEDAGPGVPPAERERVFERFYRIGGTPGHGSGLGLAIVREVCERHGIGVALGEGAGGRGLRVMLRLPQ